MRSAVFLQCRLDSSRLPGKALITLKDKTVIEHAMTALKRVDCSYHVLLTTEDSFDVLEPLAQSKGFKCFAGPKEDVLQRFLLAAERFSIDTIVRATGDNPLVSGPLAQDILIRHLENNADYSGFLGIPLGTGVEILKTEALQSVQLESDDPYDHEHVAPYLYKNPQKYLIQRPDLSSRYGDPGIKISLDTSKDLELMEELYSALYDNRPIEIEELLSYLRIRD